MSMLLLSICASPYCYHIKSPRFSSSSSAPVSPDTLLTDVFAAAALVPNEKESSVAAKSKKITKSVCVVTKVDFVKRKTYPVNQTMVAAPGRLLNGTLLTAMHLSRSFQGVVNAEKKRRQEQRTGTRSSVTGFLILTGAEVAAWSKSRCLW